MSDLAFLFVVEGPRLQAQSLILAASLRRHHPQAQLLAYVPGLEDTPLPAAVSALYAATGTTVHPLPVPARPWKQPYPHGNKIMALAAPRDCDVSVFLDTDMAALGPIDPADLPGPKEVSLVPEGIRSWTKDDAHWQRAYGHFGLALPEERIRLLRGRRSLSPPYFNAGFVAVNEADRVDGRGFGALWFETAQEFDHNARLPGKRPWLDQITLPLTLARFGYSARIVDERNNCSISNDRRLEGLAPAILHYHRAGFLRRWPDWQALVSPVLAAVPDRHRDWIERNFTEAGYLGDAPPTTAAETA